MREEGDNVVKAPEKESAYEQMAKRFTPKKPMTQEQVENWIMLKGQTDERWFEIKILDEEVGQDPTMIALMEVVSDMIFKGIKGMPFTESEHQRAKEAEAKTPKIVT